MNSLTEASRLDGRVVVVTGAASGIGAETCDVLAAAGATVVCGDVDTDGLDTTVARVRKVDGVALAVTADVTKRADVERLVDTAIEELGHIDAMCNIAGAMFPGLIEDLDDDTIDRGIDLNLKGVLYGTQCAIRAMKPSGRGSIVNVSSAAIDEPYAGIGVYAFTKAAVAMLTMTAALEAGEHGIRVNAIAPDLADTAQTPAELMLRGREPDLIRTWIPVGRFGRPDDYAAVVEFLASDDARFVTGQTIPVDGGTLAASGWYARADRKGWTNMPNEP